MKWVHFQRDDALLGIDDFDVLCAEVFEVLRAFKPFLPYVHVLSMELVYFFASKQKSNLTFYCDCGMICSYVLS